MNYLLNYQNSIIPIFLPPEYKRKVRNKEIDWKKYGKEKEREFLSIYYNLIEKYGVELKQNSNETFLDKWYIKKMFGKK